MVSTQVYAGTARSMGATAGGIFRQAAGDNRWEHLTNGLPEDADVHAITVHPENTDVVYVGSTKGAYRSTDGSIYRSEDVGQTWKRFDHGVKAEATMMGVAVHPRDPNQVYGVSRFGQVFGTQDGGKTWNETRLPEGVRDVYAVACG